MVAAFDPLAPSQASSSTRPDNSTFHTLTRERQFRHPPPTASDVPALDELVAPHISSFNALIEDDGNPGAKGLLQMGVEDIGEKVVFDGKGSEGGLGTKLSCMSRCCIARSVVANVYDQTASSESLLASPLCPKRTSLLLNEGSSLPRCADHTTSFIPRLMLRTGSRASRYLPIKIDSQHQVDSH